MKRLIQWWEQYVDVDPLLVVVMLLSILGIILSIAAILLESA